MVYYDSCAVYVSSATTLKERLVKIRAIILVLYDAALKGAETDNMTEYMLDDGQTKIRTVYNGAAGVARALDIFKKQEQEILNQLNGRITRHVDSKNLNRYGNGFR
jgi:hypothetical protein